MVALRNDRDISFWCDLLSIPGWVGNEANQFSYMQMVFGYLVGYFVVALVTDANLLQNEPNFNLWLFRRALRAKSQEILTGSFFFLGSRVIGASPSDCLLVANVLQEFLFDKLSIPFPITVIISILLIWIYTN